VNYPPPLPADEQLELVRQAQAGSKRARDRLVLTTMRHVLMLARKSRRISPTIDLDELMSAGAIGVINAIERFDFAKNVRFITYASLWIRLRVREAAWQDRGVASAVATHAYQITKVNALVGDLGMSDVEAAELVAREDGAARGMTTKRLLAMRAAVQRPFSLDAPLPDHNDSTFHDFHADDSELAEACVAREQEREMVQRAVDKVAGKLGSRARIILEMRVVADDPATLERVGEVLGVCRERVRQLEKPIISLLRRYVRQCAWDYREQQGGCPAPVKSRAQRQKEANRRWYEARKAMGICICGNEARPGMVTCGNHRSSKAQRHTETRAA